MRVYWDLVVLLNFLVDFLLLLGTNRLSGFSPGCGRCAAAAMVGGLYSGACLLPGFGFLGSSLWRVVFLGVMGLLAFGMNRSAWKRTGVFLLLTMAMGGIALGLGRRDFPALILCAGLVWVLCRLGFGGQIGGREYVPIQITEAGRTVRITALRDTGNTLRDPITGEQVLILGPEHAALLAELKAEQLSAPAEVMLSRRGFRLIPYRAVGQGGSMLLAKRFGEVRIGSWKGSALVAFAPEPIGSGDVYQALTGGAV